MISLPESIVIGIFTIICVLIGFGIKIVIKLFANINESVGNIDQNIGKMDNRLSASETWMKGHDKQDDERHRSIEKNMDDIYKKLNRL